MPILIIIVLAIFAPGVLYAAFMTAVFGVAISAPLAVAAKWEQEQKRAVAAPLRFRDHPPAQRVTLAVVLMALVIATSYAIYVSANA